MGREVCAVSVTSTSLTTSRLLMVKVALDAPAGITTVAGMPTAGLLADSETVMPACGAAPLNVSDPVPTGLR